jgi:hypothetical protein
MPIGVTEKLPSGDLAKFIGSNPPIIYAFVRLYPPLNSPFEYNLEFIYTNALSVFLS